MGLRAYATSILTSTVGLMVTVLVQVDILYKRIYEHGYSL